MSDLLNTLRDLAAGQGDKLEGLVADKGPESVDKLLVAGREWADENLDDEAKDIGTFALDALEEVKPQAVRLGAAGVGMAVGLLASGEDDEAERYYMAHEATQAERDAWIDQRGDAAVDAAAEKSQAWEAFKSGLAKVGAKGLKLLAAILLGAFGL